MLTGGTRIQISNTKKPLFFYVKLTKVSLCPSLFFFFFWKGLIFGRFNGVHMLLLPIGMSGLPVYVLFSGKSLIFGRLIGVCWLYFDYLCVNCLVGGDEVFSRA